MSSPSKHGFWKPPFLALLAGLASAAHSQTVAENKEVVYQGATAQALSDKAAELRTAVAIYEHVRNTSRFVPYWGSTSGSVNAFLSGVGNDVDQATVLIAMLRSRGIPARYATGTIRVPTEQMKNWLGMGTASGVYGQLRVATANILQNSSGTYADTFEFGHVWVEAMVPFDQYRGVPIEATSVNCVTTPAKCTWVPLDPSFKQHRYKNLNIDPFPTLAWNDADYTAYYDAIKNGDAGRKDKNPLTILEQEVVEWLRTTPAHKGRTVEDVIDEGEIIAVRDGALPASLPYQVVGATTTYDSVEQHDAVSTDKWDRKVTVAVLPCHPGGYTGTVVSQTFSLSELATDRLTLSHSPGASGSVNLELRRGRSPSAAPVKTWNYSNVSCAEGSKTFAAGTRFYITLQTDGQPSVAQQPAAVYNAMVGGRYLLATGGESSNWSQVHRAAGSLLEASQTYKILNTACDAQGANCTPYVDSNGNGTVDSGEPKLADSVEASDALVGGLLEVAATQYYAKLRDFTKRADGLMRTRTPVLRFVGVVQSDYAVQYLKDGTAFAIQPNGLLIDMKGIHFYQPQRIDDGSTDAQSQFRFIGHITSALEHETWQELTGFDAVSTVRSFQIARAANSPMKTYVRNASADDTATFLSDMSFLSAAPPPFSVAVRGIYGTVPITWSHPTNDGTSSFHLLKKSPVTAAMSYLTYSNDNTAAAFQRYDDCENALAVGTTFSRPAGDWCFWSFPNGGTFYTEPFRNDLIAKYNAFKLQLEPYFAAFDESRGFSHTNHWYRTTAWGGSLYSLPIAMDVWKSLVLKPANVSSLSFKMTLAPAAIPDSNIVSEVYLREEIETSGAGAMSFSIQIRAK